MKRTALVCALILVATPALAQRFWLVPAPHGGGPTALYFDDDVLLGFGNTSAAPDCWFEWDTAGTDDFEIKCTDVNGAGTDGIIFSVDTGTDDVVFVGNVSTLAGTISAEQLTSTDDANVTGTCTCGDVSSGAVTSSATVQGEQLTSTDDADVNDSLTCGDLVIDEAAGVLNFTGATSATISSTSGSVYVPDLKWSPGSGPADATLDERGLTCGQRTTDSTAQNVVIGSEDLYPFATQSTTAASNLILKGGLDAKQLGVLDGLAGCTGADYARAVYSVAGATATTTTCTYGTDWCSGIGADTCANATGAAVRLAICLDAGVGIGATASGAICPGGAANSRCVGVSADRLTATLTVSNNDDTCVVDGNGTDGSVVVPDGIASAPGLRTTTWAHGVYGVDATYLGLSAAGAQAAKLSTAYLIIPGTLRLGTAAVGDRIEFAGTRAAISSPSDGNVIIRNAGDTAGVMLDVTVDSRLSTATRAGVATGELAEKLLGSATITLNNAAAQTIYTVPAGFTLVPTKVVIRNPSAGTDAAVAGGWGGDANCTNYVAGAVFGAALSTTASAVTETPAINGTYLTYASAVVFCYKLTVASTDADTVTMTLFGYLR